MDESDGGDKHLVVATDNHLVGLDLEQPKQHPEPLHPPRNQDDSEDAIIQANYPDLENGTTSGDATQCCLPSIQPQLHQQQHKRPTLQCRKLLAVESLQTRQQQQQSQLLDNQGEHDSFVVRVLKQANAPPAREQTEL